MSSQQIQPIAATSPVDPGSLFVREELPLTVRQAAIYLGVSVQTVYLWVERRQIPPPCDGRNIRFLRADLVLDNPRIHLNP
jgi:excisionase family DNA binding protein